MPRAKTVVAKPKGKVPSPKAKEEASKNSSKASETITLTLTSEQLADFFSRYVCLASAKEAEKKLLSFKGKSESKETVKPAPNKDLSRVDLNKLSAKELESMALKKANKTKVPYAGKGKNPTKKDNIDFILSVGASKDSEKSKKGGKGKKEKNEESESESTEANMTSDSDESSSDAESDCESEESEQNVSSDSD